MYSKNVSRRAYSSGRAPARRDSALAPRRPEERSGPTGHDLKLNELKLRMAGLHLDHRHRRHRAGGSSSLSAICSTRLALAAPPELLAAAAANGLLQDAAEGAASTSPAERARAAARQRGADPLLARARLDRM